MNAFAAAFGATFAAILQILLIVFAAGVLVRLRIITQPQITALSTTTINVFLPCLIAATVLHRFDPGAMRFWWLLPLLGIAMSAVGLLLAAMLFAGRKRHVYPLASLQNAGFLVLPVGLALYPDQFESFALYCFLFILGFNPVLWSVGKLLVTGSSGGWRGLVTPPLLANVGAVVVVLANAHQVLPAPVVDAARLLGEAAVPVATFVLGAVLGSISIRVRGMVLDAVRVVGIKLLILPALTMIVLLAIDLNGSDPLLARFLLIEAAAAPAVGLVLQVRQWGGNEQDTGSLMLLSYLASAVTLPTWLAVWDVVVGG